MRETKMQRERRERAEVKAARLQGEANARFETAHNSLRHIPPGQPVLVGHHSEARHRRDLARHDNNMRKGVEAQKAAEQAKWSAGNAGRAVTSDDPEAVEALTERLEGLEAKRTEMKAVNKAFKKGGWEAVAELIGEERAARLERCQPHWENQIFPKYALSNLGANIRRIKKRVEELKAAAERPEAEPIEGDGFRIEEDKDDCRIRFYFDERPDRETCRVMRRNGFKFSRAHLAWQRLLNSAGRHACLRVAGELFGYESERNG